MRVRRALNRTFYYVNPVNCFMFDLERQDLGADVVLADLELNTELEGGWSLAVAMPWHSKEGSPCMQARDVQHLMDSPWMARPTSWHDSFGNKGWTFTFGSMTPCQATLIASWPTTWRSRGPSFHFRHVSG